MNSSLTSDNIEHLENSFICLFFQKSVIEKNWKQEGEFWYGRCICWLRIRAYMYKPRNYLTLFKQQPTPHISSSSPYNCFWNNSYYLRQNENLISGLETFLCHAQMGKTPSWNFSPTSDLHLSVHQQCEYILLPCLSLAFLN